MKNSIKKTVTMLLAIILLVSTSTVAYGVTEPLSVDLIHDFITLTDENESLLLEGRLSNADVLLVDFDEIETIADYAKELVDLGVVLYIKAPEVSRLELSQILGIPIDGIPRYNSLILLRVSQLL